MIWRIPKMGSIYVSCFFQEKPSCWNGVPQFLQHPILHMAYPKFYLVLSKNLGAIRFHDAKSSVSPLDVTKWGPRQVPHFCGQGHTLGPRVNVDLGVKNPWGNPRKIVHKCCVFSSSTSVYGDFGGCGPHLPQKASVMKYPHLYPPAIKSGNGKSSIMDDFLIKTSICGFSGAI